MKTQSNYLVTIAGCLVLVGVLPLIWASTTRSATPPPSQAVQDLDNPAKNSTQYIFTAINTPTNTNPSPTVFTAGIPVGKRLIIDYLEITSVGRTSVATNFYVCATFTTTLNKYTWGFPKVDYKVCSSTPDLNTTSFTRTDLSGGLTKFSYVHPTRLYADRDISAGGLSITFTSNYSRYADYQVKIVGYMLDQP